MFDLSSIIEDSGECFAFTPGDREYIRAVNQELEDHMSPYAARNDDALRASGKKADLSALRGNYAVDVDRILHHALYNRGADKTQVFSFYRNDDITRRAAHVQLVSRIARIIGRALRLNLDLIEAIAIGHDIGHTPFGHKGEEFLSELYYAHAKKHFRHNVHSVRILKTIRPANLTLQTLDGILCHNGEKAFSEYAPAPLYSFEELEKR